MNKKGSIFTDLLTLIILLILLFLALGGYRV